MHGFYNWLAFGIVAAGAWATVGAVCQRHPEWSGRLKKIILAGFLLRVVGAFARYEIFWGFYDGGGDATGYYRAGYTYAQAFWNLDFGVVFDSSLWWAGKWWGTQFVRFISGAVVTFLGPSMRGEFLIFSLFAFVGLLLAGAAFHRSFPWVPRHRYLVWLLLWPSLWFWPSSVGKEAVVMLALGLAVAGHIGDGRRPRWILFTAGIGLAFLIRPHFAAVLIASACASYWLTRQRIRGPADLVKIAVVSALALAVGIGALQRFGIEQVDLEGVQEFMEHRATLTEKGGSAIGGGGGLTGIPMAFVNILVRPFPWEAHHVLALGSSLEMLIFWFLVWRRRRTLARCLKGWRSNRLLTFALPFAVLYTLMIGLVFHNLGIIARQRVLVFPFLFILLEAQPIPQRVLERRRRMARDPRGQRRQAPRVGVGLGNPRGVPGR